MKTLLDVLARTVQRHPGWLLAVVAVATGVLGFFATQQEAEVDITAFAPDTELANAFDRVQSDFSAGGGSVQVILDAGPGGDVVSPEGVRAAMQVQQAVTGDPEITEGLVQGTPQAPAVVSFASPIVDALQQQGLDVTEASGEQLDQIAAQVLDMPGPTPLDDWREAHRRTIEYVAARMAELQAIDRPGHAHLTVAVRDLARLTTARPTSLGGAV